MKTKGANNILQLVTIKEEKETTMADYLKLVTGGKELPPNGDWLSLLDKDTVFSVKDKKSANFALGIFKILDKTEKTVYLGSTQQNMPPMVAVIPVRFCQNYDLWEVICSSDADLVTDPEGTIPLLDLTNVSKDTLT
jgi:hypothetical protein